MIRKANKIIQLLFAFMIMTVGVSANEMSFYEGSFGDDGQPTDCMDAYYADESAKMLCHMARTVDLTVSTFMMAVIVVQVEKTSRECSLILKTDVKHSFDKIKTQIPRSILLALKMATDGEIRNCDLSRYHMKDMFEP